MKKAYLFLLVLLSALMMGLISHAQQYKLTYMIESDFLYTWQDQVWDDLSQQYVTVQKNQYYTTDQFRIFSYTFRVEYVSGAVQDITITPAVVRSTSNQLLTYAGSVILNGTPKQIRFKSVVGLNSGNIQIASNHDEIVYSYPANKSCPMSATNYGNSYYHNITSDYYTRCILSPQIYPVIEDKPSNVSGLYTACGGQTITLKAPCVYDANGYRFVAPVGAPVNSFYDVLTWEVSEDLVSWKALNKYRSQITIDENDYNDINKKYNTPRYYRVKMGPITSDVADALVFKRPAPSPNAKSPQSPQCFGAKGKMILSDFRYPDGSVYTGQETLNYTLKPKNGFPGNSIPSTGTSFTFDNLDPGDYDVSIINADGCTQIISFTIASPPAAIQVSAVQSCSGGNPALTVNASGGIAPYQYSIDNGNTFGTTALFTNLSPGTNYQLVIKDNNSCTTPLAVQMLSALTLQAASQDPSNPGASDGSITLTPGGGAGAPYTYSLDNVNWQSSNTFSGLKQGTYNSWIKDNNGCTNATALSVTLKDPQPVIVTPAVTQISCNGQADGSMTVSVGGGRPPFTYSMDGTNYLPVNSFANLSAGTYTIWAKDSKGNTGSAGFNIVMPPALNVTVSNRQDALCIGAANGQIAVAVTGGTGAYQYALNAGAYQPQSTFTVAAGQYTVTVMDANGCRAVSPQVNIAEPALAVAVTAAPGAANCNGEASGNISVGVSNGVAPYQYQLNNGAWQAGTVFNGLRAGTYTVNVKDNNGCPGNQSNINVTEPPVLTIALDAYTDATCFNIADGSIRVSAVGGTGNVLYYISTAPAVPNTNGVFNGLAAGDYTVTAKDDHSCTTSVNAHIAQPTVLQLTANIFHVTCYGIANGKITLQPAGGTAPYTYSADGITFISNNIFDNLSAGNYTLYIKDSHTCSTSISVTVTQPPLLSFSTAISSALCQGTATGTVMVTATGGTGAYKYNLDGNPFRNGNVLGNIAAGTHLVSVMDINGCIKSNNVFVGEPTVLTLQMQNQQPASCFGSSNGALTVQAGGGTAPYQYAINGGAYQATPVFSALAAGTYTVTVKDANTCTFNISVTVTQPSQLSLQVPGKTDILCAGAATGHMQLQAAGGMGAYLYSLNGGASQTSGDYGQLPAGNYNIIVKDNNQCTANFSVLLVDLYPPLTASLNGVAPATCDDKGTITVINVQGGLPPYGYSLDNTSYTTNPLFSNLHNGDYTVYTRDANGCIITRSISPYGPVSLHGTLQMQPVLCNAQSNGSIKVINVTGGNKQYEYSLDGISYQASPEFLNLRAGVYQVHVRDVPNSCHIVLTGTVKEPVALALQLINNTPVSCFNDNNGALAVQAAGGAGSYRFSLNGGAYNNASGFSSLTAGNYTIRVQDANGCVSQLPATVTQPPLLTATIAASRDISCFGNGNGQITISAGGGTVPYLYTIDNINYQSSTAFDNLPKGSYSIRVKDNNGCMQSVKDSIAEPDALHMQVVQKTDIACFGAATGRIALAATGGKGAYAFALNNLPAQNNNVFTNLTADSYLLSMSDANGCVSRQSVILQQPAQLQLSRKVQQPACSYTSDGSIAVTVSGGVMPYAYNWSNVGSNNNAISNLNGGLYKVTITDANGCRLKDSALLVQPAAIPLNIGFRDTVLCVGQSIIVDAGNPGAGYSWESDAGFSDNRQAVQLNKDGHYKITVTAPSGCVAKDSFNLKTSLSALTADFLLSSYGIVGDTVVVIDVSKPKPLTNDWTLPNGARDAGNAAQGTIRQLLFDKTGNYTIKLRVTLGECTDVISKNITILPKEQSVVADSLLGYRERLIKEITAYPNPNDGPFKVRVRLSKVTDIQLRLISFNSGDVITVKTAGGSDNYEIPFDEQQLPQGIYLVAVQVGKEYQVIRVLKL
ncbi:SprB-like repeat protein [Chitinophaga niastensis]|uniref:SprB-like repeat protein n=1 Tax=Chitinophaga niastensis TaxID=536980 RepID=A0A2P8HDK0_CHINA|nr:hypothetical protein [Chitinophaga niastensis]PSL44262.1 SprB-like repeat protein [Chitinophaga niastensis]